MTKKEIIAATSTAYDGVLKTLNSVDESVFLRPQGQKWSIAENVIHLEMSVKPLNLAYLLPKFVLNWRFGKPNRPSRTYDELVARYRERVSGVVLAGTPFQPLLPQGATKQKIIQSFEKQHLIYFKRMDSWGEEDLDAIVLPHPALGKITLREMGFFTTLHLGLHHDIIKRYL
ncbi:MAG: hypothetical protein RI894_2117 [Bacteroidota bacterium]|jgi:hypothetical protein